MCVPIKLKSSKSGPNIFPYAIIYEFFKLKFGRVLVLKNKQRTSEMEEMFKRQVLLLDNVMRSDHKMWKKCEFKCAQPVCSLTELRQYHHTSLSMIKSFGNEMSLQDLVNGFNVFIKERTFGPNCAAFGSKFLKRQKRIVRRVDKILNKSD